MLSLATRICVGKYCLNPANDVTPVGKYCLNHANDVINVDAAFMMKTPNFKYKLVN